MLWKLFVIFEPLQVTSERYSVLRFLERRSSKASSLVYLVVASRCPLLIKSRLRDAEEHYRARADEGGRKP
jgi:hypothetical protein